MSEQTIKFEITIAIKFDPERMIERGENYLQGLTDSVDEFAIELNSFLERQPLVESVRRAIE